MSQKKDSPDKESYRSGLPANLFIRKTVSSMTSLPDPLATPQKKEVSLPKSNDKFVDMNLVINRLGSASVFGST